MLYYLYIFYDVPCHYSSFDIAFSCIIYENQVQNRQDARLHLSKQFLLMDKIRYNKGVY